MKLTVNVHKMNSVVEMEHVSIRNENVMVIRIVEIDLMKPVVNNVQRICSDAPMELVLIQEDIVMGEEIALMDQMKRNVNQKNVKLVSFVVQMVSV